MIDIRLILNNPEMVQRKLKARDPSLDISNIFSLYEKRSGYLREEQSKRQKINKMNKSMSSLKGTSDFDLKKIELKSISDRIKYLSELGSSLDNQIKDILLRVPNLIQDDVPISQNKEDSIETYRFGEKKFFEFIIKDHLELTSNKGIIDFNRGAKLAATGFPLYMGKGAVLEFALIQFMLEHSIKNGFTMIMPPILNNTKSLINSGNLPKFAEQVYSCKDDELHLIPTSEVPLTNMFADETLSLESGPLRYVAYTPNFRREAGSYGKRDKGLMRLHQFNKIETYTICKPSESRVELEKMVINARTILEQLGLHFRVANLPSCDLAQQSSQTYDVEIWLPHQERYSEVSSASNCTDYQARRAKIKFKEGKECEYVHTLNCSGLATPRLMIALLESNQTKDGNILVPAPLVKYTGFEKI